MDLKETDILGDSVSTHWYYQSKAAATRKLLERRNCRLVLDVGAGSAFFSRDLMRAGQSSEAWCVDISYPSEEDIVENGKSLHFRRSIGNVAANVVLLMDVLEHVDDDVALLSDYVAKVPSGTTFLISVPAFRFLWSDHDVYLEHKRRYTLREVEELVLKAGLTIDRGVYYFGLLFPLVMLLRLLQRSRRSTGSAPRSQLQRHGRFTNGLLSAICAIELRLISLNRLLGLTVFCVAIKA